MRDPEELIDGRRARRDAPPPLPVDELARTSEILRREREEDSLGRQRTWLARWRGDKHTFAAIAADEKLDVDTIRAGIDAALLSEGRGQSIATIEHRPRVTLGRGLLEREPQRDHHAERRQLRLLISDEEPRPA